MSEQVLPCFACGRELKPVFPGGDMQQADDACAFRSYGQYGSTIFDPEDRTYLEINICDTCLAEWPSRVLRCQSTAVVSRVSYTWNPGES